MLENFRLLRSRTVWATALCVVLLTSASMGGVLLTEASTAAAGQANWYFAEGYTGAGFQEYICVGNPGGTSAGVSADFMFKGGGTVQKRFTVGAMSRFTIDVNAVVGQEREVSAVLTSDHTDLAMERPMYFNYAGGIAGSHCVAAAPSDGRWWYFAEGYTGAGFDQYLCVLNPSASDAALTFAFQTGAGQVVKSGAVPAHSRATFKINDLLGNGRESSLALGSNVPVVAERPMYFHYSSAEGRTVAGGHCVMGAASLAKRLYFAEGTTRCGFDEWLTLQNPDDTPITVTASYQVGPGQGAPVSRSYAVGPQQRRTVAVASEVGRDKDVSVLLTSPSDFLAERPMYYQFSHSGLDFQGGQCALGTASALGSSYFAEGYTGPFFEEWLCLQNTSSADADVEVTYLTQERGALPAKTVRIGAASRVTVFVNDQAGPDLQLSAEVRVVNGSGVVAERSMYFDDHRWKMPAGANQTTTPPVDAADSVHAGLYGMCFSPYLLQDPGAGAPATSTISSLITAVSKYSGWIRTFGSEDEWALMASMGRAAGMKVAGGCDIYTDIDRNAREVAQLKVQASARQVDMAVVGDEVMLGNVLPEDQLISYINQVRSAGVATGTSDSWDQWVKRPNLVAACDVILMNAYPYWEGTSVDAAVASIAADYGRVKQVAGNKPVIIETGWPSGGAVIGDAVPGRANSARYLAEFLSWADSVGAPYFYFEAFDELWKASREGACGRYWGLWDENASLKPEIAAILKPR